MFIVVHHQRLYCKNNGLTSPASSRAQTGSCVREIVILFMRHGFYPGSFTSSASRCQAIAVFFAILHAR
jgi:hypothetical protein